MRASRGGEGKPLNLREAIRRRGFTLTAFAEAVGVKKRVVTYWLAGQRQPSRETAIRIARALGLSPLRVLPNFVTRKQGSKMTVYDPAAPLLSHNLRAARLKAKLTQHEVAEELGIPIFVVGRCERGDVDSQWIGRIQSVITQRLSALASPARRRGRPRKYPTGFKPPRPSRARGRVPADDADSGQRVVDQDG